MRQNAPASRTSARVLPLLLLLLAGCAYHPVGLQLPRFAPAGSFGERVRVLELYPGVTTTVVAPARLDARQRIDLILYALPNGSTTAQTIGESPVDSANWRYDIQHIGAQTRVLRTMGIPQAVVAYLEADVRSWSGWRAAEPYERTNAWIVRLVDQLRTAIGNPPRLAVTLTGHSGGGSFAWGFIDGQDSLPPWLERVAFLDSNYSFEPRHGEKLVRWLAGDSRRTLVVLAYDDREITLDGRKVVSETGGTWRASQRMLDYLRPAHPLTAGRLGEFIRYHDAQIEILLHPNPENRILHTVMVGELNGYMHALLVRRPGYEQPVLGSPRAYTAWLEDDVILPPASPPDIPPRAPNALAGTAFMASVAALAREERETAIRRELLAGNIPSFLRALRTVRVTGRGADRVTHTIAYEVMPDYLAIGSDDDYVRMPMNPYTAQAFCDAFGFVLPTSKMVDAIWAAADVHLEPRPLAVERDSPLTFLFHHRLIEQQLAGTVRGSFVAGIKKDVVVTNQLTERPNRVAIYGWHYLTGEPIQPVYAGHVDWYVDYSHGIRPVRRTMVVDGTAQSFEKIMGDARLRDLLSDEGELAMLRYDR